MFHFRAWEIESHISDHAFFMGARSAPKIVCKKSCFQGNLCISDASHACKSALTNLRFSIYLWLSIHSFNFQFTSDKVAIFNLLLNYVSIYLCQSFDRSKLKSITLKTENCKWKYTQKLNIPENKINKTIFIFLIKCKSIIILRLKTKINMENGTTKHNNEK